MTFRIYENSKNSSQNHAYLIDLGWCVSCDERLYFDVIMSLFLYTMFAFSLSSILRGKLLPKGLFCFVSGKQSTPTSTQWWVNNEVKALTSLFVIKNTHFICLRFPIGTSMFQVKVANVILHGYNRKSQNTHLVVNPNVLVSGYILNYLLLFLFFLIVEVKTSAGLQSPPRNSYSSRQFLFFGFLPRLVLSQTGEKEQKQPLKNVQTQQGKCTRTLTSTCMHSLFKSAFCICPIDTTAAGEDPAAFLAITEMLTAE